MGKLTFIYGTMGSAKSANVLMQYFELKNQSKQVLLIKPAIDTRDGSDIIKSRIGLQEKAITFKETDDLSGLFKVKNLYAILVDECQFCTKEQINMLKLLTIKNNIKVYCYGLKTDFTSNLFEGSKRLLEIADEVKELEMTCTRCGSRAEINARIDKNGNVVKSGNIIELGSSDKYSSLCYKCWLGDGNEK